ncbi:MAG: ATP-binding protein [Candidatus Saccharibacteria bacterium]|nr:ATP-binding protein [Candidatus Saccharibacteria bacterium]
MNRYSLISRLAQQVVQNHLKTMPVAVITGARQTGKSTLAKDLISPSRQFYSLDDFEILSNFLQYPRQLLSSDLPITIDEIQLAPSLLKEIKLAVDHHRIEGQFLLTGSANLLLMKDISESLAGRASYITLWPTTRRERLQVNPPSLWQELLSLADRDWLAFFKSQKLYQDDWQKLVLRGGFPTPAWQLKTNPQCSIWFDSYIKTYLERDLRNISLISSLPDFRRIMQILCLRIGQLLNQAEISRITGIPQPTIWRYINLLEISYMLIRLPAYTSNKGKSLLKTPKIYWADTGLGLHISKGQINGFHLENLILTDFMSWNDASTLNAEIFHWRTTSGQEVDFVIEYKGNLLPMEIKASNLPTAKDIKNIHVFQEMYPQSRCGILLHSGQTLEWLSPKVLALPWWYLI